MSFLDEQATGQIGIGEKANLSTLTRRRRKRKKGQAPTGAETYSLMPQDEFSNIVSSPTDIQQVGIGNLLQAQGSSAGKVPNVFEEYKSAAPIGSTIDAIYPPPEEEEEDDDDDEGITDKLPQDINPSSNIYDMATQTGQDFAAANQAAEMEVAIANVVGYTPSEGNGGDAGGGETGVDGGGAAPPTASNVGSLASGGTVKAKNKNSFMSMKGK